MPVYYALFDNDEKERTEFHVSRVREEVENKKALSRALNFTAPAGHQERFLRSIETSIKDLGLKRIYIL